MLGPEDILPPSFGPAAAAEPEFSPKSATILQERLPAPPPIVDSGHQDAVSMKGTNEEEEEAVPDLNEVPSLEELARVEAETPVFAAPPVMRPVRLPATEKKKKTL